ncbi:MAG: hypothetical protein KDD69_16420 [Bdellovibrionales bacterium]|nr:hypothetical protein [Bdellovibrionales bacterium]
MKQVSRLSTVLAVVLLVSGCARGFDRAGLTQQLQEGEQPQIVEGKQSIGQILELRPQLPERARLGVLFEDDQLWADRIELHEKLLDRLRQSVRGTPFVDVVVVEDFDQHDHSLDSVKDDGGPMHHARRAAARFSCDAVLVVRELSDKDEYVNPLFAFDIFSLTLTGFFLPAHHYDYLVYLRGSLWDVRNGYLYMTATGSAEDSTVTPLYWKDGAVDSTEEAALNEAFDRFLAEVDYRIGSIRGR